MSFVTDLFEGKTSNLGNDLKNPLDDASADFSKQPAWAKDLEIAAPLVLGGIATGGFGLLGEGALGAGGLGSLFGGTAAAADAGADALGFAGDVGADLGTGAVAGGGDALSGIDAAIGATGGALPGDALSLAAPGADVAAAAPSGLGAAWPASADLGLTTAGDVGGTAGGAAATGAGAPLALGGATGTAGTAASGTGGVLSSIGAGIKSAAPFVGAAGLAGSLFEGYEQKQAINATNKQEQAAATQAANTQALATSIAAPLINQGTTLTSYLSSGTLPPQFQSQVDQAIASQKAGIIQGYASRGMSTNPNQNSQLQQDLAAVENSKATLMTQLESQLSTAGTNMINTANQMLAQGLAATTLEANIPIQISKLNLELNQSMMQSISNFAAAMGGTNKFTALTPSTPTQGTA